jgi:hypothetical protein
MQNIVDKAIAWDAMYEKNVEIARLRKAMHAACDLLAERIQGSPARSAQHNARILLESELAS